MTGEPARSRPDETGREEPRLEAGRHFPRVRSMSKLAEVEPDSRPKRPRRRFRRCVWRLFVLYVMVSLLLSFIPERPLDVEVVDEERAAISGELFAGAGKAVISPPEETWGEMNLYGEGPVILGIADDIHARALTMGVTGSGELISLVSIELLIIPPALRPALEEELTRRGLDGMHITLNATHTHSGPGNFWDVPLGRFFMGEYHEGYFRFLVERTAEAIEASVKAMRPARIGFSQAQTRHLVKHRRYKDPVTGLRPPVDEELEVIRVDSADGSSVIAYALSLGAHPTALLHETARRISADFPGAISRLLEERHPGAVALFLQGAQGSVRSTSPRPYDNYDGKPGKFGKVALQADMLLAFVTQAEADMKFDASFEASFASVTVALPGADAHFFPEERPYMAVRILTIIPNWIFNRFVDWYALPETTVFQALRINHTYVLAFPCDLSNRLGWEIKRHIRRDHVLVLAPSNDYSMGYVLAREEYDMGGIASLGGSERGQCFFGKRAGPYCVKVAAVLAAMVKEQGTGDVLRYRFGEGPAKVSVGRPDRP